MKRNENEVVVRTKKGTAIIYLLLFTIISALMAIWCEYYILCTGIAVVGIISFIYLMNKKVMVFLNRVDNNLLIVKDEDGKTYIFEIDQILYSISRESILLYDYKNAVVLKNYKKIRNFLKRINALKKELK